jgi:hypothetical protein
MLHLAAAVALHRSVVSWARDAGAPRTAQPRRGPRKPGPVCMRAHPRREAEPCPASPCRAMTPPWLYRARRPCDTAATSRSRRGQALWAFPRAPTGRTPHTLARTQTHGHPEPEPHRIRQPHQIRWETDKRVPPIGGSPGGLRKDTRFMPIYDLNTY